jgi:hypothetical protein
LQLLARLALDEDEVAQKRRSRERHRTLLSLWIHVVGELRGARSSCVGRVSSYDDEKVTSEWSNGRVWLTFVVVCAKDTRVEI